MSAPAAPRGARALPNGIWGMLLLVATEATLLSCLVGTYFYLRFRSSQWPPAGIAPPSVALPLALTGLLLLTSVPMVLAALAAGRDRRGTAFALVAIAAVLQSGYLAWQIVAFLSDLDRFSPTATSYGSIYFTMLAADHAHVAIGILLDLWILGRLVAGLNRYRLVTLQAVAVYWIFVGALTVAVTFAQVSPS